MCKQGGRSTTFSHTLAKVFEEHFHTFENSSQISSIS